MFSLWGIDRCRISTGSPCVQLSLIAYFMFGYQSEVGKFFIFFAVMTLTLLVSESIGMLFAMITVTADLAIVFLSIIFIVLLSLTGFLATDTPVYYEWIEHINFIRCGSLPLFVRSLPLFV